MCCNLIGVLDTVLEYQDLFRLRIIHLVRFLNYITGNNGKEGGNTSAIVFDIHKAIN